MSKARTHGRLYVTKHLRVPEKPLARLNFRIATYTHSVDNDTDELRAVLIADFEPRMSLLLDAFMKLRDVIVRPSEEIRTICDWAALST